MKEKSNEHNLADLKNIMVFLTRCRWLLLFVIICILGTGRFSLAPASLVAPVFALRFWETYPEVGRKTIWHFYLALWLALSLGWYGATPIWGPAHFIFMGVNAFFSLIPYLVHHWVGRHLRPSFLATLAFPLAAVSMELLALSSSPLGNFGADGYSYYGFNILIQLTSVTGMLGIMFITAWFAAVVNWVWSQAVNGQSWSRGLAVYAAVLVLTLAYGGIRLSQAPSLQEDGQDGVAVAAFTLHEIQMAELMPLLQDDLAAFRSRTKEIHEDYLAESAAAAAKGAKIILWPELAGIGIKEDVAALLAAGSELARENGVYLAVPSFTVHPEGGEKAVNELHLLDPAGEVVLNHVKFGGSFMEGSVPGDGVLRPVKTPYGTIAAVICWDTDFPRVIARAGRQGVDILLSPAKDWPGIDPLHGRMSAFRAVENGMTVVRQADAGWSVITDPYGRTLSSASGTGQQQMVTVPTTGVETLYPYMGELVGWISLAGLLGLAGWTLRTGKRVGFKC